MIYFSNRDSVWSQAALSVSALHQAEQVRPEEEDGQQRGHPGGPVQRELSRLSHGQSPVPLGGADQPRQRGRPGGRGHDAAAAQTAKSHFQGGRQQQ